MDAVSQVHETPPEACAQKSSPPSSTAPPTTGSPASGFKFLQALSAVAPHPSSSGLTPALWSQKLEVQIQPHSLLAVPAGTSLLTLWGLSLPRSRMGIM